MEFVLCILIFSSCFLTVVPLEERLLVGDNTLQGEIQELRSKMNNMEHEIAVLKSMSNTSENTLQSENQKLRSKMINMEHEIAVLKSMSNTTSRQVVFMSQLSRDLVNPAKGHIVIFDNVITNIGHAYSRSTGVFRAPVDGNYIFNMIASNQPSAGNHCLHLLMRRNRNAIGYIFLDSNHDFYFKRTENVVVSLTKGDEVYVQVDFVYGINHSLAGGSLHSHFSGFLIH